MTTPNHDIEFCSNCNLILENGAVHIELAVCVQAQQIAMINQKKAAEGLSYALSTKYLEVLEILCVENGAEFQKVRDAYVAMGDWSPMKLLQDELKKEQELNVKFQEVLAETERLSCEGKEIPFLLRREIRNLLDPGGLHLEADGPPEE
jgi:hypothetical protein